jgi:putative ubiquitin-RnfH superfamily antitoxin RatB of RatAB toxin-antitoxin module
MKNINIYRQKFEDPKGVIRKRRSKENRQYNDPPIARGTAMINILVEVYATKRMKNINIYRQKFEDPKGVKENVCRRRTCNTMIRP